MFSLDSFYRILQKNLFDPIRFNHFYFDDFGSVSPDDINLYSEIITYNNDNYNIDQVIGWILFYDQEPMYQQDLQNLQHVPTQLQAWEEHLVKNAYSDSLSPFAPTVTLFANSEHSQIKENFLKNFTYYQDWYYFFHGFAALDWYKNIEYLPLVRTSSKVFICFNNLFTEKRSYRLNLVARLLDKNLQDYGYISLGQHNQKERIKQELFSEACLLSKDTKKLVYKNLMQDSHQLVIDTEEHSGFLSADDDLDVLTQAMFHVVTETVYYDEKLHLTEKIFKPIVARRPFFLVAAPGNLAYLKSYGFKTFDQWIDESYDLEPDSDQRVIKIVNELERLCQLDPAELEVMFEEMQQVLEYNFQWFYNGFKKHIVNELVDNFETCLARYNSTSKDSIDYRQLDFELVKQRLAN